MAHGQRFGPEDFGGLSGNEILERALLANSFYEVEACLAALARRRIVSNTKLILALYRKIQSLHTKAGDPGSIKPTTTIFPDDATIDRQKRKRVMLLREHSALWYCGYTAAKKEGLSTRERHEIIDAFYSSELNPRLIKECGDQGCAKSYRRGSKIASTLTAHIRNFSRNDAARYAYAISVWEADLAYVRSRYLGSGGFHVLRMGSITA